MTSLRTVKKSYYPDGPLKKPRYLRCSKQGSRSTLDRLQWKNHKRMYGTANIGPDRHAPEQLEIIKTHVKPYMDRTESALLDLWFERDWDAYFKAYRMGRQACFILAGIHLAAQRRAVKA